MKNTMSMNEWTISNYHAEWDDNPEDEYRLDLNERYLHAVTETIIQKKFGEMANAYLDDFMETKFWKEFRFVNDDGIPLFIPYEQAADTVWNALYAWFDLGIAL